MRANRRLITLAVIIGVAVVVGLVWGRSIEGVHQKSGNGMTMSKCAEKCADGHAGGTCIQKCCKKHCEGTNRTTQGCKHYCGIEARQRNTPRRILPHVSTYPTEKPRSASEHAESDWPKIYSAKGKPLGHMNIPPHSKLLVPSVKQQEQHSN